MAVEQKLGLNAQLDPSLINAPSGASWILVTPKVNASPAPTPTPAPAPLVKAVQQNPVYLALTSPINMPFGLRTNYTFNGNGGTNGVTYDGSNFQYNGRNIVRGENGGYYYESGEGGDAQQAADGKYYTSINASDDTFNTANWNKNTSVQGTGFVTAHQLRGLRGDGTFNNNRFDTNLIFGANKQAAMDAAGKGRIGNKVRAAIASGDYSALGARSLRRMRNLMNTNTASQLQEYDMQNPVQYTDAPQFSTISFGAPKVEDPVEATPKVEDPANVTPAGGGTGTGAGGRAGSAIDWNQRAVDAGFKSSDDLRKWQELFNVAGGADGKYGENSKKFFEKLKNQGYKFNGDGTLSKGNITYNSDGTYKNGTTEGTWKYDGKYFTTYHKDATLPASNNNWYSELSKYGGTASDENTYTVKNFDKNSDIVFIRGKNGEITYTRTFKNGLLRRGRYQSGKFIRGNYELPSGITHYSTNARSSGTIGILGKDTDKNYYLNPKTGEITNSFGAKQTSGTLNKQGGRLVPRKKSNIKYYE